MLDIKYEHTFKDSWCKRAEYGHCTHTLLVDSFYHRDHKEYSVYLDESDLCGMRVAKDDLEPFVTALACVLKEYVKGYKAVERKR
ncbi:MAG: hypothetical protein DRI46_10975 [Chloroflexi bacterium]|nr:MAG: hypothetical protein DRI46_10975 [Chloroflexota bacterium]